MQFSTTPMAHDLLTQPAGAVATAATPSPTPSVPPDSLVTPQPIGFFSMLFVALAVMVLGIDLVRRIRRVNYRAQIREKLEAEQAEQASRDTTPAGDPSDPRD